MQELVRPRTLELQSLPANGDLAASPPAGLGWHLLYEFYDCRRLPQTVEAIQAQMVSAAELIGATIVQAVFHQFNPYGLSGVVVIAESHLAVHTWPEYRCAAVDLFTCSAALDPRPGMEFLSAAFQAGSSEMIEVPRGGRLLRDWRPGQVFPGK